MNHMTNAILSLFTLAVLVGCASSSEVNLQKYSVKADQDSRTDKLDRAIALNSSAKFNVDPSADYRIGQEDVLDIDVYQAEELKRTVRVSSQGLIGLPLIGQLQAKGLTTSELEKEIAQKYDRYLESPIVS